MEPSFSTGPIGQPAPAPAQRPGPIPTLPAAAKVRWLTFLGLEVAALVTVGLEFMMWTPVDIWIPIVAVFLGIVAGTVGLLIQLRGRLSAAVSGTRRLRIHPIEMIGRVSASSSVVFVATAIAFAVNCVMDPSAGPAQRIEVVRMDVSHGKSAHYNLHLRSWLPNRNTVTVSVDSQTWREIETAPEGQRFAMVELRNGRLGLPWIGSVAAPR